MKFIEWRDTYLNIYLKPRIKYHTYLIYDSIFKLHINDFFEHFELEEVTKNDLNLYLYKLMEKTNKRTNNKLSPGTINLILTLLKSLFKAAYENEIIPKNPTLSLKKLREENHQIIVLSKYNQKKLEDYVKQFIDDSRYLGILLTLYSGLRIGELLALKWENVNLKKRTINVEQTKVRIKENDKYVDMYTVPKTSTSKRIIPIPEFLIEPLLKEKDKNNEFVISYNGDSVKTRSYQNFFESVLKKTNIPIVNFHVLRHTFATRCVELGIDIKTISELLGHKNATITLNRYSHSLFETKRKAIKKLSNILKTN